MANKLFKNIYTRSGLTENYSPSGDEYVVEKGWIYEDGELIYKEKGKTNLYEKIQAARDSVDLQAMLARYEAGDDTALQKVQGMYIDTVDMPKNYADLYTAVSRANEVFDSMPVEIKEEYDNNPAAYWRAFGTEEFDKTMNAYRKMVYDTYHIEDPNPVVTAPIKEEVKEGVIDVEKSE